MHVGVYLCLYLNVFVYLCNLCVTDASGPKLKANNMFVPSATAKLL